MTKKSTEVPLQKFLVVFNFLFNRKIVGAEYTLFVCKEKEIDFKDGVAFFEVNCLKFFSTQNVVILYNTSIISISLNQLKILINAKDNKTIHVELPDNEQTEIFISNLKKVYTSKIINTIGKNSSNLLSTEVININVDENKAIEFVEKMIKENENNKLINQSLPFNDLQINSSLSNDSLSFNKKATFDESKNIIKEYQSDVKNEDTNAKKDIINEKNKDSLQNVSFKTSNLLGLVNTYNQHDSTKNKLDKCEISQDESSSCKMLEEKFKNEIQHSKVKKPLKKKRRTSFKLKNYKPNKNKKYFKVKSVFKEKETLKKEIKEWFVLFNKANAENYKRNYKKAKRKKQLLLILIQTKVKII